MRAKIGSALLVLALAFLLVTNPSVVEAAKQITGKQIKNNSVTGKDIKEASLAKVPKAKSADKATTASKAGSANTASALSTLPSGQSQSGAFGTASGSASVGYMGFAINYPRPLATAIANGNIIDTFTNPDPAKCPGAGQAAPGYLCLYFQYHNGISGAVYGYSSNAPYSDLPRSVGVGLYAPLDNSNLPYLNGVWTVTAP